MKQFLFFAIFAALCMSCNKNKTAASSSRSVFQELTGSDTEEERESWNAKYKEKKYQRGSDPEPSLKSHLHLLPKGKVLLYPLEDGTNAIFLAQQGFKVWGIDYSDAAIQKAYRQARAAGVSITGINANLEQYEFEVGAYDAIIALDFFRPRLVEQVKKGLKKNGVVFYINSIAKPGQDDVLGDLKPGELPALFSEFKVIVAKEIPPTAEDGKTSALLIGRKP
ncbi:MAG: class I SAM-dependent methyltransferase [Bdellovibrionales bacterium]|nr:class I SAM-dependent methyltransferase [Bdellovibrionales bacterium]